MMTFLFHIYPVTEKRSFTNTYPSRPCVNLSKYDEGFKPGWNLLSGIVCRLDFFSHIRLQVIPVGEAEAVFLPLVGRDEVLDFANQLRPALFI